MGKIDKKDKKILSELVSNSRMPLNQLARKVGISKEVVHYRIKKLKEENVILDFYTLINIEVLGFLRHSCFFQLKNISNEEEKEFIDFLVKHDFISYIGTTLGKWNIVFDLFAKNKEHLELLIKELIEKVSDKLESYSIISSYFYHASFPTKVLDIEKEIVFSKPYKKQKLDEIDFKILSFLSKNSRIEYKELANKLNLAANTIKYRIKNLEKNAIILGYSILIDSRKFGYEWQNIQIKLTKNDEDRIKKFLKQSSKVIYVYQYLGNENWDFDIGVIAKSSFDLREFIIELRKNFGDSIKVYDFYTNLEIHKGGYAPSGIFNNR